MSGTMQTIRPRPGQARTGHFRALGAELFEALREMSKDGAGVTRASYSAAEDAAHLLVANTAMRAGLAVRTDEACNTWIEMEGSDPGAPAVLVGSHLDSVRQGGNYDGAAGVVGGLLALLALKEGPRLRRTVRTVAFRGEESAWFGTCYVGSRAAVGTLTGEMLDGLSEERRPLRDAMREAGADMEPIEAGRPLVDLEGIHRYVELHIEQGPVLVEAGAAVGAVTGIRGNRRFPKVEWLGEPGHSGAVPRAMRRDAVLAMTEWLSAVEREWDREQGLGSDLVMTAGVVGTDPLRHGLTRVPEFARVSLDIRSVDEDTLERVSAGVEALACEIAERRRVRVEMGARMDTAAAAIAPSIAREVVSAAAELGYEAVSLPSGAGHDAAALAEVGVPICMIFVRNENGSHNPLEALDIDDFVAGVDVLTEIVERAAR